MTVKNINSSSFLRFLQQVLVRIIIKTAINTSDSVSP